jgi:hypothetical protein
MVGGARLFSGIFFFVVVTLVHLTVGNVDKSGSSGERAITILGEGKKEKTVRVVCGQVGDQTKKG